LGFRIECSGVLVLGLVFAVYGLGVELRVQGLRTRAEGVGFRV